MLTRWHDLNRSRPRVLAQPAGLFDWPLFESAFPAFESMRTRMNRLFDEYDQGFAQAAGSAFRIYDAGEALVVETDAPGFAPDELEIDLVEDTLTIAGTRKETQAPEGYETLRRERSVATFSRSFTLPAPVDPERVSADLADGVLTVRLAKAAEVQPRRITVNGR